MRISQSLLILALLSGGSLRAATFTYNNLIPNGLMAMASGAGAETADDFVLTDATSITSASFIGLMVPGVNGGLAQISNVSVEIYKVYPLDSDTTRTPNVVTRTNSPADVATDSRTAGAQMSFSSSTLSAIFTASNSVQPGGIHPAPNQTTGGNGAVTGQEVQINVNFISPFSLDSGHYFFVPVVTLDNGGVFYWLSASRPISGSGTTPFAPDLQTWIRNSSLAPDWSRVGTDIVGGATPPTFNAAFSLNGNTNPTSSVPEPSTVALSALGLAALAAWRKRHSS